MNTIQTTNNIIPVKAAPGNNDQHSVVGGHTGTDLDSEDLDLYRFMLGGLLSK
ncbi:hypothetical protein [Methanococcoides methylutens]|uniref:hypothetical protein n=1 Tax=Methanococcoides methylutens TaxID=2226 RepID=UPI0012E02959|nr:hypothetical protein [Methanococcoides methylutens]